MPPSSYSRGYSIANLIGLVFNFLLGFGLLLCVSPGWPQTHYAAQGRLEPYISLLITHYVTPATLSRGSDLC